jgi:hypothetical protein
VGTSGWPEIKLTKEDDYDATRRDATRDSGARSSGGTDVGPVLPIADAEATFTTAYVAEQCARSPFAKHIAEASTFKDPLDEIYHITKDIPDADLRKFSAKGPWRNRVDFFVDINLRSRRGDGATTRVGATIVVGRSRSRG